MIIDEEVYLEHHGTKGQKWGIRNKAERGDYKSRSKKQKAGLVVGGVAGWFVAGQIIGKVLGTRMPLANIAVSGTGAIAGARMARSIMDRKGDTRLSDVPKE